MVQILAKIYDEFLMRKRKEMDTTVANEDTFRRALELILEVRRFVFCFVFTVVLSSLLDIVGYELCVCTYVCVFVRVFCLLSRGRVGSRVSRF